MDRWHAEREPRLRTRSISPGVLARLVLYSLLAVLLIVTLNNDVRRHAYYTRGIESGLGVVVESPVEPHIGTNAALERYPDREALSRALRMARGAGVSALRQSFRWEDLEPFPGQYRWEMWDDILPLVHAHDLQLTAVLHTTPTWARPAWQRDNPFAPPEDLSAFTRFAAAFAARYGEWVLAYQIWDQPNIAPHWGGGEIDPAAYVEMLRLTSAALREADPEAIIVAGGLAPNTEPGGRNMSDVVFLREIHRRGAADYYDVLGVRAFGFWSGPYDRRVDADILNFSRTILLREELVSRGLADRPVWMLDGGWCALSSDWEGDLPAQGSDLPLIQSERLTAALQRLRREWPWMTYAYLQVLQPDAEPDDPTWGFALIDARGETTALYHVVQEALTAERTAYPGVVRDLSPYLIPIPATNTAGLRFWGSDLLLEVRRGIEEGTLWVQVDGSQDAQGITLDSDGLVASGDPGDLVRVPVDTWLRTGTHWLHVEGTPEQRATIAGIIVGHRTRPLVLWLRLLAGGLFGLWCVMGAVQGAAAISWRALWGQLIGRWGRVPTRARQAAVGLSFGALALAPMLAARLPWAVPAMPVTLAALLLYALAAALEPWAALGVAVLTIPLAPVTIPIGPGVFSLAEIAVLVAGAAFLTERVLAPQNARLSRPSRNLHRPSLGDVAVLMLVVLGLASTISAEYQRVALREWRLAILEPALLYAMLRQQLDTGRRLRRTGDLLFVGALGVALYGLIRYPTSGGVIEADGVRRARAYFGSPNNLALYLERLAPLGAAVAVWGGRQGRRWLYGVGAGLMGVLLILTYSRGALFLGVPAALMLIMMVRGGRRRALYLGVTAATLLLLVSAAGIERFSALTDITSGTTHLRLELWRAAWQMVRDHPWLGVGPDNFLYYYGDYISESARADRWLSHPHNLLLDFWLRLGAGGLLVLAALVVAAARHAYRVVSRPRYRNLQAMALGLTAGLAAALTHGLGDAFFFVPELALWTLAVLAWLTNASRMHPAPRPPEL